MSTDIAALKAMIEALEQEQTGTQEPEQELPKARQFSSLGFVVVGDGPTPSEGDLMQVPTKAGKVARVRLIDRIDTSQFDGEFGEWAFTYKRLKRGES